MSPPCRVPNLTAVLAALWLTTMVPVQAQEPPPAQPSLIVSPTWLADQLGRPDLVILHVGDREGFEAGHIAGSRWISLDAVADPKARLRLTMPAPAELKETFEKLGISDSSRIVLYFGKDQATQTARVFVSLEYLGMGDRVSVLDGGLPAWRAAGYGVTVEVPSVARGTLTPRPDSSVLVNAEWIAGHRTDAGVAIVDARLTPFYTGEDRGRFVRSGRIAGARSVPFVSLLTDTGTFKPRQALERAFAEAGVAPGDTIISYCHIGQQASLVYLAARWLGHTVRLYDGSFEEWSAQPDLPVETGPGR